MKKQQTAVEWLNDELGKIFYLESDLGSEFESSQVNLWMIKIIAEAKAMEKEQIVDANISGMEFIPADPSMYKQDAEQYYNETYGN